MTAQAIVDACSRPDDSTSTQSQSAISVVQLPDLRERDFRSLEGTKVGARPAAGTEGYRFRDPETHAEMALRADRFISTHLIPLLSVVGSSPETEHGSIVVVAHGMILNVLLKRLLARFSTPAEVERLFPGRSNSDWMAPWRNTAYLDAVVSPATARSSTPPTPDGSIGPDVQIRVLGINCVDHLQGLKKTRGGIGSARFDKKQQTVDSFFKASPQKRRGDTDDGG
jgi:hypothetical protein